MTRQNRFVSLRGHARKWIAAEDDEPIREDDAAIAPAREHEWPARRPSRPLARLADVWPPTAHRNYPTAA